MIPFPEISPEIFSVSIFNFTFALRWYALSYILGFVIALMVIKYFLRRGFLWNQNLAPMSSSEADNLITHLIFGVIIGGRIGYVLFYNLEFYIQNPIEILKVWTGGMSFHGGFLGLFWRLFFCRKNGISLWPLAFGCSGISPGYFLAAWPILNVNSGVDRRLCHGVVFPSEMAQNCPGVIGVCARHPSQLYEALLEGFLLFILMFVMAKYGALRRSGLLTGIFLSGYGAARFCGIL